MAVGLVQLHAGCADSVEALGCVLYQVHIGYLAVGPLHL